MNLEQILEKFKKIIKEREAEVQEIDPSKFETDKLVSNAINKAFNKGLQHSVDILEEVLGLSEDPSLCSKCQSASVSVAGSRCSDCI